MSKFFEYVSNHNFLFLILSFVFLTVFVRWYFEYRVSKILNKDSIKISIGDKRIEIISSNITAKQLKDVFLEQKELEIQYKKAS